MKIIPSILVTTLLSAPSFCLANDIEKEIKAHCEQKWGNEYDMVLYCYNEQVDAVNDLNEVIVALKDKGQKASENPIIQHCWNKWTDKATKIKTDYQMVMYCVNQQIEAKQQLDKL